MQTLITRPLSSLNPWECAAHQFVTCLLNRQYEDAHLMLCQHHRSSCPVQSLQEHFTRIAMHQYVPLSPAHLVCSVVGWPDQKPEEQGMCYVSIGGDYNEAVIVSISEEDGCWKVSHVEWGRP